MGRKAYTPTAAEVERMTKRLLRRFDTATDSQREKGAKWYRDATDMIAALAEGTPYTADQCAAAVAALSPNITWTSNVTAARKVINAHALGHPKPVVAGYNINRDKAWRILDGELSALCGPKVTAFYRNLTGDPDHVTVDVWATRAAAGREEPGSPQWHEAIATAYRNAAHRRNMTPRDFQAVVWTVIRESWIRPNGRREVVNV